MERIRLTDPAAPRFGEAFSLYEISFPIYERRTRAAQSARLSHPEYHFDLLVEGEQFLGLLLFWEAEGFRYVEHFATCPQLRGRAWGQGAGPAEQRGDPRGAGDRPAPGRGLHPAAAFFMSAAASSPTLPPCPSPLPGGLSEASLVVMTSPAPASQEEYDRFAAYLGGTVMEDCKLPLTETEE